MAIHKLNIDEFDEIDYCLFAIHTSLEDYRLAYFINQRLSVNLNKTKKEIKITVKQGEAHFSRFHYYEKKKEISWNLIQNKNEIIKQQDMANPNLFSAIKMEVSTKVYMLPEFKKADYFLKIENSNEDLNISNIQHSLHNINSITTMYIVDPNTIKSKNNLIF